MAVATKTELFGENSAGDVMSYTVASATPVPKGTLMRISATPRTAIASSLKGQVFVGIASAEKDSLDDSTNLGVWQNGVFEMTSSGSITFGDTVVLSSAANTVEVGASTASSAITVGMALNDAAGNLVTVRVNK